MNESVSELGLSIEARSGLLRLGISTIQELDERIENIRLCGKIGENTKHEIETKLNDYKNTI